MPVITAIKQQKKKDRINVYLDNKFGFGIDLDNFVLLNLRVDRELTDKEVQEIVKKAEFQKTWEKLLKFAMTRPRSTKELSMWFKKKEVHESIQEELTQKLKHFDLLDDEKFAAWWVAQRQAFRPKPRRILVQELRLKGIEKTTIDKVVGVEEIDEKKMAQKILEKRSYKWKNMEPREAKAKMSQYLAGKGFSWEVIGQVVKSEAGD